MRLQGLRPGCEPRVPEQRDDGRTASWRIPERNDMDHLRALIDDLHRAEAERQHAARHTPAHTAATERVDRLVREVWRAVHEERADLPSVPEVADRTHEH